MEYYKIDPHKPSRKAIKRAVQVLKQGGIIVYPTNTLYGLGVDVFNKKALDRLFVIKQRGPFMPVSLMVASLEQLTNLFGVVSKEQYEHFRKLLPGKFTVLVESRFKENLTYLSSGFTKAGGKAKVGFRVAELPVCKQLVLSLGSPVTSTSANLTGNPNARNVQEVVAQFGDRLDLILDAGPVPDIRGSTIIDFTKKPYLVLREGAVALDELKKRLPDVPFKTRKRYFQVTFICSGNICRSPMAMGILEEIISKTRFKDIVKVSSAGTLAMASGAAHPFAVEVAQKHGIDLSHHQARSVDDKIMRESDLIICLAVNHYESLREEYPQFKDKIVLLREWHRRSRLANPSIADPISHGMEFFEVTFDEIQKEIKRILPYVFSEAKKFMDYHEIKFND
ncbi:MAG: threonylcarbamoyl-AMP synthase [Calditrichaeota bacterium]|nr:threonylcarbamoyl-AMP synthase [Calditrichota bacterium]